MVSLQVLIWEHQSTFKNETMLFLKGCQASRTVYEVKEAKA